jgi:hypothetical protein
MRHEDYKEMLALEAADALEAGERAALEEHLSSCAECRAELREMSDVASALAFTVAPVAPPAHLRSRLLEQIHALAVSTQAPRATAQETRASSEVGGAAEVAREERTAVRPSPKADGVEDARRLLARLSLRQIFAARRALAFGAGAAAVAFVLLGVTTFALWGRNAALQSEVVRLYERLHQSQDEMVRAHEQLARARDVNDMLASPEASVM